MDSAPSTLHVKPPAIELNGVWFGYGDEWTLEDVTLAVGERDFLGIIGPNGGGKTTLLKIMLGLLEPQKGFVRVEGRPPDQVRSHVGYVPQYVQTDASVPATVLDTALTGRLAASPWGFRYGRRDREAAREALARAGVEDLADRPFAALSGGQRQRVLIARALAADIRLLLLDEPMAGVDAHMEESILETLHRLNRELPIVLVSHDLGFVSAHVKRVVCLNRKAVVHRPEDITEDIVARMYGAADPVRALHHHEDCPTHEHKSPASEEAR